MFVVVMTIFPISFWSTRDATNYSEVGTEDCPMQPSSETSQPLPKMRCHDPDCQQYFMGNNYTGTNKTMEAKCWEPAVNRSMGSLFN
jgi:hypothetical protein